MPYISAQYRTSSLIDRVRSCIAQVPIVDTKGRTINLAPWPRDISEKGVVSFTESRRPEAEVMKKTICKPDVLILATGYTQTFGFLDETYPKPKDATMRTIWKLTDPSIAFIGFVRPSFGMFPIPSWRRFQPSSDIPQEPFLPSPSSKPKSGS